MTSFGSGTRGDERPGDGDDGADPYLFWDAAYVLGSLSSADRHEYSAHLSGCPSCRDAVAELSGMPALLALLDRDAVAALDDGPPEPLPARPEFLESLLAQVTRKRRRVRLMTATALAAAAVILAVGLVFVLRPGLVTSTPQPPQPSASALTLTPVVPTSLQASVNLTSHGWGTSVEMSCTYRDEPGDADDHTDHGDDAGDRLALVALGRDGSRTQIATWTVVPGVTAQPTGSTSMQLGQIAAVQVVSSETGDVLLQRTL